MDEEDINLTSVDEETYSDDEEVVGTFTDSDENTSDSEEIVEAPKAEEKLFTQEQLDKAVSLRLKREERKHNEEISKYQNLVNTLKTGMGEDDSSVDTLTSKLADFYRDRGVEIPEYRQGISERDERILANADADEIIEAGEDEINRVANEIYNKPVEQRSIREKAIFEKLGNYMMDQKARKELADNGINTDILEDKNFSQFASQFNRSTKLSDIYNMYTKVNSTSKVERPASMGSTKTSSKSAEIKERYTYDEISKMTAEELKNPKLMRAVEKSLEYLYKHSED